MAAVAAALVVSAASAEEIEENGENNFATRSSTDFVTTPPPEAKHDNGIFAAGGRFTAVLQLDNVTNAGPDASAFSNLFGVSEFRGYVTATKYFTLNGLVRFDQARDQLDGGAFNDQALYVQRLFGVINLSPLHFYGGKIHPRFGVGWYATPGIYGNDFTQDYELQEKLGFGVRLDLHTLGDHRITFETFHSDTSFLAPSLLPGPQPGDDFVRRQAHRSQSEGGVANTGTFESFAAAIDTRNFLGVPDLSFDAGWSKQRASPLDERDEYSWVVGLGWKIALSDDVAVRPLVEFASQIGQAGFNLDVHYLTLAASLDVGPYWSYAIHLTTRDVHDNDFGAYYDDYVAGIAVAYDLGRRFKERLPWLDGISAATGYRHDRQLGIERDTIGLQLRYEKDF